MKFAARFDSEPGWKAILSREDGSYSELDIKQWGLLFVWGGSPNLVPLDASTGEDIRERHNFVKLISPNDAEG